MDILIEVPAFLAVRHKAMDALGLQPRNGAGESDTKRVVERTDPSSDSSECVINGANEWSSPGSMSGGAHEQL